MLLLLSAHFFKINYFEKFLSGIPSECQTDWIQIRPDVLSGLIWVQSVCKGYEQTTLGGNELREQIIHLKYQSNVVCPPLFF